MICFNRNEKITYNDHPIGPLLFLKARVNPKDRVNPKESWTKHPRGLEFVS